MYIAKAKALTKNWRGAEVVGEEFGGSKTCFSESTIYTFIKFSCIVNISPDQCSVLERLFKNILLSSNISGILFELFVLPDKGRVIKVSAIVSTLV